MQTIVPNNALPEYKIQPLPQGANNIFKAGYIKQQNQTLLQSSLVGGRKRVKKNITKGGGGVIPVVIAPSAPSFDPTPNATNANLINLTKLATQVSNNAIYDKTVNGTQQQVDRLFEKQMAPFKGGSLHWGCLSGGKKSRKHIKGCKCKRKCKSICKRKTKCNIKCKSKCNSKSHKCKSRKNTVKI